MQVPQTSKEAWKQVTPNMKASHYGKIMSAMRILGFACSMEIIAKKSGLSLAQVGRRMSELMVDNLVHVDGIGLTSNHRRCQLYSLTLHGKSKVECQKDVDAKNTALKCVTNDFPQKRVFTQQPLF